MMKNLQRSFLLAKNLENFDEGNQSREGTVNRNFGQSRWRYTECVPTFETNFGGIFRP